MVHQPIMWKPRARPWGDSCRPSVSRCFPCLRRWQHRSHLFCYCTYTSTAFRGEKTDSPKLPHNCDEALDANCLAATDTTEFTFLCATGAAQHSQNRLIYFLYNTHTHTPFSSLTIRKLTIPNPTLVPCFRNQLF